jgi:hypothetical protein
MHRLRKVAVADMELARANIAAIRVQMLKFGASKVRVAGTLTNSGVEGAVRPSSAQPCRDAARTIA